MEVATEVVEAITHAVVAGSYWTEARQNTAAAPVWELIAKVESDRAATLLARFASGAHANETRPA